MNIGSFDTAEAVLVVAEIGNNHEGDLGRARELVEAAADAGARAVKFQTFATEEFVAGAPPERIKQLKAFELGRAAFEELAELAHNRGLLFISTPLDVGSARFLRPLVDAYKVASGDNDFWALMAEIATTARPVIISSGLTELDDLQRSVDYLRAQRAESCSDDEIAVLYCVSAYPVPDEQANLRGIEALRSTFSCTIGYSDHTLGIEAACAAVALGADVIEKHFTLDKQLSSFRDHSLSADPTEMAELVRRVEQVSRMLGEPTKTVQECEIPIAAVARRSIVAAKDLTEGHRIESDDLTWMRPPGGLRPGQEGELVGRTLQKEIPRGGHILLGDVE